MAALITLAQSTGSGAQPPRPQDQMLQNRRQQAQMQRQLQLAMQQEAQLRDLLKMIKSQLGTNLSRARRAELRMLQGEAEAQLQATQLQRAQFQQAMALLAAQQAALAAAAQQAAAQETVPHQAVAQSAAQQAAAEEAFRRQVLQRQQAFYNQLYKEDMPERPATDAERRQRAIAKILGAVFFKVLGEAGKSADNVLVAALAKVVCDRFSAGLIEEAIKDVFPHLPDVGVRAIARAARLCLDGKLSKINYLEATAREELKQALKADRDLAPAVEGIDFLIDLGQAAARRAR
jgi:hypothetical protein